MTAKHTEASKRNKKNRKIHPRRDDSPTFHDTQRENIFTDTRKIDRQSFCQRSKLLIGVYM